MRKPDVDLWALRVVVERALPGSDRAVIARTSEGGSTQVYRIDRGGRTYYLRVGEEREAGLASEALVHGALRARSVRVPEVVYLDEFDEALERSVMITTETPGRSLAEHHVGVDARAVLMAAGRDLAVINGIELEGFGWIRRDRGVVTRLEAELPTLREFAIGGLENDLAAVRGPLTAEEVRAVVDVVVCNNTLLWHDRGRLVHGDLDATHIYHRDGEYTGIIDFGEIRGADDCYDLGHYALHDGQTLPGPTLPYLLEGYAEVTPLPMNHAWRIALWSVLIGVSRFARGVDLPPTPYQDYLIGAVRRSLAELR